MTEKIVKVIEVTPSGTVDKSGPPLQKHKASKWLSPDEIEALIRKKQKPEPSAENK